MGRVLRRPGVAEWSSGTPDMGSFPGKLEPSEFSLASSRKGVFNYKSNSFFITSTFSQRGLNEIHELCRVYTSVPGRGAVGGLVEGSAEALGGQEGWTNFPRV